MKKSHVNVRGLERIEKRLKELRGARLRVGVLSNDQHDPDNPIGLAELAAIHEFGSPAANIPERSFIRRTFREKRPELLDVVRKVAKGTVKGKITAERGLNLLGAWLAAEVKKTVTDGPHIPPPLQPETIARKGSDRPLVDTGRLVDAITWDIVTGDVKR